MSAARFDYSMGWRSSPDGVSPMHPKDYPVNNIGAKLLGAACQGDIEFAKFLIQSPSMDVDFHGSVSWTPLLAAARHGHIDVVKELLRQGADWMHSDDLGQTAIILAAAFDHILVIQSIVQFVAENSIASVDFYQADNMGRTALSWAATSGHAGAASILLKYDKTPMDFPDLTGLSPLAHAAKNGQMSVAQVLLHWGANKELGDVDEATPIMHAAEAGHRDLVALLLQDGGPVNTRDSQGRTALVRAAQNGCTRVVELLLQRGATPDAVIAEAAYYGHIETMNHLLDHEADIESGLEFNRTPLILAAMQGRTDAVRLLLHRGAEVDNTDNAGRTALMWAALYGHEDTVRLLVERGGNACAVDHKGVDAWTLAETRSKVDAGARRVNILLRGIMGQIDLEDLEECPG